MNYTEHKKNNAKVKSLKHFDFENDIDLDFWTLKRSEKGRILISDEYSFLGKKSLKVTVNKGDRKQTGGDGKNTERNEISEQPQYYNSHGQEMCYKFSVYFPSDFYIVDNRLVFAQWKEETSDPLSPIMSLNFRNGKISFNISNSKTRTINRKIKFFLEENVLGKWNTFKIQYKISTNHNGFVKAWHNDRLFVDYKGHIGYRYNEDLIYFKMGLYRDELDVPQTIFIDEFYRSAKLSQIF